MLLCCDVVDDDDGEAEVEMELVDDDVVAVECDPTLTTVGIVVIDNGGGPFDMAGDTVAELTAAAAAVDVEVD